MPSKILTKCGIRCNEADDPNNDQTFIYNGRRYKSLIDVDVRKLIADISYQKDFKIEIINCGKDEFCCISHNDSVSPGNRRLLARLRIFSIIFPKSIYLPPPAVQNNENDTLHKEVELVDNITSKFYELLRAAHESNKSSVSLNLSVEHKRMIPKLRNYQQRTIQWMLQREKETTTIGSFFKKLTTSEGSTCYVDVMQLQIKHTAPDKIHIPSGGILADEMGLGKTVEVLAMILLNPRPIPYNNLTPIDLSEPPAKRIRTQEQLFCLCSSTVMKKTIMCSRCFLHQHEKCVRSYIDHPISDEAGYICPNCWESLNITIPSGATVIVSPLPIKLQWLSEIIKHTEPSLNVLVYNGVSKKKWSPCELAKADIVLTDYNILRREIHFMASNETTITFRKKRQVMRVNSPLMLVEWWRVCLDEAQMESAISQASQTVKQLPAVHRWAVTGTPIQRSLDDLLPLLQFLGFYEVCSNSLWQDLTAEYMAKRSSTKFLDIMQKVMWRTCKSTVLDELDLPPQTEMVHYIELNDMERLFYSDEHAYCAAAFYERIEEYAEMKRISPKVFDIILQPMLKLRQDCTIPVLRMKSEQNVTKKFLQPQELLDHLRSTNELECKNFLRTMASSYNGMAAINILQFNYAEAIKHYKLVLKLAEDYNGAISVDSMLQIHALHNIIHAISLLGSPDKPCTKHYESQCSKLEWKYLEPYSANLKSAYKGYKLAEKALLEAKEKASVNYKDPLHYWCTVIDDIPNKIQLLHKINEELFTAFSTNVEMYQTTHEIIFNLNTWYAKLKDIRKEMSDKFGELNYFVQNVQPRDNLSLGKWLKMNAFIKRVYACHLSDIRNESPSPSALQTDEKEFNCELCKLKRSLHKYECLVFNSHINNAGGSWNPTVNETILKAIFGTIKSKCEFAEMAKQGELQLEIINLMKTECKELKKLWIEIEYTVKAYDELNMCKMRLGAAKGGDPKTKYQIWSYEYDAYLSDFHTDYFVAQKQFVLKHSRLKYIKHLEKNADPGACPICREDQTKYAVLECGHHICLTCLRCMALLQKAKKITCSVCRNEQEHKNVYYVHRKPEVQHIQIKGDYSSKVEKIVLEVLRLRTADENVKILIFSQWEPILKVISDALSENSVSYRKKWCPESIEQFKNSTLGITCLLMLLHDGSRGLNLVEATHVFLVEPILNPSEEAQAISRIQRIGQTKVTSVHRFISKDTIEENIYNAVTKEKTIKFSNLTIERIKPLFEIDPMYS